jgi:hypothetical protein
MTILIKVVEANALKYTTHSFQNWGTIASLTQNIYSHICTDLPHLRALLNNALQQLKLAVGLFAQLLSLKIPIKVFKLNPLCYRCVCRAQTNTKECSRFVTGLPLSFSFSLCGCKYKLRGWWMSTWPKGGFATGSFGALNESLLPTTSSTSSQKKYGLAASVLQPSKQIGCGLRFRNCVISCRNGIYSLLCQACSAILPCFNSMLRAKQLFLRPQQRRMARLYKPHSKQFSKGPTPSLWYWHPCTGYLPLQPFRSFKCASFAPRHRAIDQLNILCMIGQFLPQSHPFGDRV